MQNDSLIKSQWPQSSTLVCLHSSIFLPHLSEVTSLSASSSQSSFLSLSYFLVCLQFSIFLLPLSLSYFLVCLQSFLFLLPLSLSVTSLSASSSQSSFFISLSVTSLSASSPPLPSSLSVTSLSASSPQSSFLISLSHFLVCLQFSVFLLPLSLSYFLVCLQFSVFLLPLSLSYFLVCVQAYLFLPLSQLLPCLSPVLHRKKSFASFPSPAGMSLPNSPWAGIMTS
jgi:hypothetical protein